MYIGIAPCQSQKGLGESCVLAWVSCGWMTHQAYAPPERQSPQINWRRKGGSRCVTSGVQEEQRNSLCVLRPRSAACVRDFGAPPHAQS